MILGSQNDCLSYPEPSSENRAGDNGKRVRRRTMVMIWTVIEEQMIDAEASRKHAGGKARADLSVLFASFGFQEIRILVPQEERETASVIRKLGYHWEIAGTWERETAQIKAGDTLVLQFPVINHTLLLGRVLRRLSGRGVRIATFIHDLELIRSSSYKKLPLLRRLCMKKEEEDELRYFDQIIVHNDKMKSFLREGLSIPEERMVSLGIFDYLTDEKYKPADACVNLASVIIAGNLNPNKAAYVYRLPDHPDFELYGINYTPSSEQSNIHYHGSFLPEELPFHLTGGFGLVWDGDSAETCTGAGGNYMRYNNPHKTSLYLASGIPVIIWEEAAMADFILENRVGFTVRSLSEIQDKLARMKLEEYREMKRNAFFLSSRLRNGAYTHAVLMRAGIPAREGEEG